MDEEADEVVEEFVGQLRIALAGAAQMAEKFARLREDLARQQQARTEQQTRELRARFDAERDAARAAVAPAARAGWWQSASANDIADAYETAHAWEPVDAELAQSAEHMRDEIRDRYGLDVNELKADPTAVWEVMERTERERADAAQERGESVEDLSAGVVFMETADRLDREGDRLDRERDARDTADTALGDAEPALSVPDGPGNGTPEHVEASANRDAGDVAYDSAERRGEFAASMERDGLSPEFIRGRIAADQNQATHPREAAASRPKTGKARTAARSSALQRERGGLSR